MIYSVFAGLGSTYLANLGEEVVFMDLESSDYQWVYDEEVTTDSEARKGNESRVKNEEFPMNYVRAIEYASEDLGIHVLISAQPEVLKALEDEGLPYITVTPAPELKNEYIERYKERGNPKGFIDLMDKNFENFTNDMATNENALANIIIRKDNTYLTEVLT